MVHKYSAALVGARGYAGLELARLLLKHPHAKLDACYATDSEFRLSSYLRAPGAEQVPTLSLKNLKTEAKRYHAVFLATPAEASIELAPQLLESGVDVIDLSGAFRLRAQDYPKWYGFEHPKPELLKEAQYGLLPWQGPAAAPSKQGRGRLVANPGCYATSVLLAILPLLKQGLILPDSVVIDAKSGTSGAGRRATENLLFTEVEGECLPYKVGKHQHLPEISLYSEKFAAGKGFDPFFTTSLINVRRGIISSIYSRLSPGVSPERVRAAYASHYGDSALIDVASMNDSEGRSEASLLSLKKVVGTARSHIRYKIEGEKLFVFSLLDNLLKGAAGQAIENFNRLFDLPTTTALEELEGIL